MERFPPRHAHRSFIIAKSVRVASRTGKEPIDEMPPMPIHPTTRMPDHDRTSAVKRAMEDLRADFHGDIRSDQLSRAIYATDASIYEIMPDAVAMPRSVQGVQAVVRAVAKHCVPITARGAGTGLAGGAVNGGVILDLSRHMNRILEIDADRRIARVEPGVVLDELNAELRPHGLHFAPDVATSSRATLGGMIANNSCGAHSVMYGRTVDHVIALDLVLADGERVTWGGCRDAKAGAKSAGADRRRDPSSGDAIADRAANTMVSIARDQAADIAERFPKVMRRNGGYALDRLRIDGQRCLNPETLICGSEGTLAVVVGATLNLTPIAAHRGLVVAHFRELSDALTATPATLEHTPAAVELIDRLILHAAKSNPVMTRRPWRIEQDPGGILMIELYDDDPGRLRERLESVVADLKARGMGYAWPLLTDPAQQDELWFIRKSGLGLLMSKPGDRQTYDFVEDTAVDPSRLRDYIDRFKQVLEAENVSDASYYAHASVGCLHVKPILNLKSGSDIEKMYRIADRISSLALEFGGTMTGEHGDGILRSGWLEKMYGPRIIEAFRKIKNAFDPQGILNPGKIVDPYPMRSHFRYGADYRVATLHTTLDFSRHGGIAGMAEMCSGVGQCRQKLVGTMCPSYMATGDEQHTTRARANALRIALSNRDAIRGLDDPVLHDAMDLCLSCKACKSECPTGVDMARLKAEWLWHGIQRDGAPLRSRLIAGVAGWARVASRWPAAANAAAQNALVRSLADRFLGLDRRVAPPKFARRTFRQWWAARRIRGTTREITDEIAEAGKNTVVYFVDTWTNHFTPQVGIATVQVLEALGARVVAPPVACCGRPAISKGLLDLAAKAAEQNVALLAPFARRNLPIITTEPSCLSAMIDEWPQLVRSEEARLIAAVAASPESVVMKLLKGRESIADPIVVRDTCPLLLHAHCHQKALTGAAESLALLQFASGGRAVELNTGCCGMAGSFGHEREHYDVSRAIGEQRLFPAVRDRGASQIAVTGFSCRHQIECHTGVSARHVMEFAADSLFPG